MNVVVHAYAEQENGVLEVQAWPEDRCLVVSVRDYGTGIPGVFICSAATPPGAGAHGMCGYNAAQTVLHHLG